MLPILIRCLIVSMTKEKKKELKLNRRRRTRILTKQNTDTHKKRNGNGCCSQNTSSNTDAPDTVCDCLIEQKRNVQCPDERISSVYLFVSKLLNLFLRYKMRSIVDITLCTHKQYHRRRLSILIFISIC